MVQVAFGLRVGYLDDGASSALGHLARNKTVYSSFLVSSQKLLK